MTTLGLPVDGLRDRLNRYPSAVLLSMQVLAIVAYPFIGQTPLGRAVISLLGTLVLGIAVWTVRNTQTTLVPALVLGSLAVVGSMLEIAWPDVAAITVTSDVAHVLFYFFTSYAMVRYLFGDEWVTSDDLFAVGAAFTLLAWGFAYLYEVVQSFAPGSFDAGDGVVTRTWFELLYLSFASLTGVGLSSVVPVTQVAQSWTMLEQLIGVLYVAMVISRMVALTVRRHRG